MKVSLCEEKLNDFLDMIYNLYHSVKKENIDLKNKIKELENTIYILRSESAS